MTDPYVRETGAAPADIPFGPDCRCWCQVRPIVCALVCCGCIVHDHTPALPGEPDD